MCFQNHFLMCGQKEWIVNNLTSPLWQNRVRAVPCIFEWLYNQWGRAQMRPGNWAFERTNSCIILDRAANQTDWGWFNQQNSARALWSRHRGAAGRSNGNAARLQYLCVCDTISQQGEVELARLVNMRKDGVRAQLQTMSVGLYCGSYAHCNKYTDRAKGRGPKKEYFNDEIMEIE